MPAANESPRPKKSGFAGMLLLGIIGSGEGGMKAEKDSLKLEVKALEKPVVVVGGKLRLEGWTTG
jgi:hypothetical protein